MPGAWEAGSERDFEGDLGGVDLRAVLPRKSEGEKDGNGEVCIVSISDYD